MQESNATGPAPQSSKKPHCRSGEYINAHTRYPHAQVRQTHSNKSVLAKVLAFFRRILGYAPKPIIAQHSAHAYPEVVFRSTTSTFITPIGGYAGNTTTQERLRNDVIEQFKYGHSSVPNGTPLN